MKGMKNIDSCGLNREVYYETIGNTDFMIYDDVRKPIGNNELYNSYGATIRRGIVHKTAIADITGIEPIEEIVILPCIYAEAVVCLIKADEYDAVLNGTVEIADIAVSPATLKAGCIPSNYIPLLWSAKEGVVADLEYNIILGRTQNVA